MDDLLYILIWFCLCMAGLLGTLVLAALLLKFFTTLPF